MESWGFAVSMGMEQMRSEGTHFRKPFDFGTWVMFPRKGTVRGPGGKFLGRQLARKNLESVETASTTRTQRPTVPRERSSMPVVLISTTPLTRCHDGEMRVRTHRGGMF